MTTEKMQIINLDRNGGNQKTQVRSTRSDVPQLLPAALKAEPLLPILERLCSAKRTVELTVHQAETWCASLSVFEISIVTEVVIRIAHADDPFPDLGKIVTKCEELRRQRAGVESQGPVRLGTETVKKLMQAWGV